MSVRATGPSHSSDPSASRIVRIGRRPEAVLVEREAGDRQRVVDPDDLAREQVAVAVDREVGREVGGLPVARPGAWKP